jgi:hypothetical protein
LTIFRWRSTTKIDALPRPVGATVFSLLAIALAALALPVSSLAEPPAEGSDAPLAISPSPAVVPTRTVGSQSQTVEFELRDEGGEEATVEKVVLEGEDADQFNFSGSNCGGLQPGEHCSPLRPRRNSGGGQGGAAAATACARQHRSALAR